MMNCVCYCNCDGSKPYNLYRGVEMVEVGVGGSETVLVCPRCGKSIFLNPTPGVNPPYFQTFDKFHERYPDCSVESHRGNEADQPIVIPPRGNAHELHQ